MEEKCNAAVYTLSLDVTLKLGFASSCYTVRTWSSTLREEPRLKVSENIVLKVPENIVLKKLFRLKRKKVTGKWRIFHYEELHDLYFSKKYNSI